MDFFFSEIGSFYIALAVLELAMQTRLALNSASLILGLKECTTMPGFKIYIF